MNRLLTTLAMAFLLSLALLPSYSSAHCDTMDGPTVADGKMALSSGDITPALKWIMPEVEAELNAVFDHVLKVRGSSESSRELADQYFLETLVRLHRAGEGAPYTGVKPSGTELEPAIKLADESLESRSVDALIAEVTAEVAEGIRSRFDKASAAKAHKDHNVEAGRSYVAAYVTYVHYVENIAAVAAKESAHAEPASAHQH